MTAPLLPAHTPPPVDHVALPAGTLIGRYEVLAVLGHGGFGITYCARDSQLGREVAIKEYLPAALAVRQEGHSVLPRSTEVADDFGWGRGRFIEEGRTLANLHDAPSIVKVFDFLEENGTAYIVMELLRGRTLDDHVREQGPLAPAALEAIVAPLLAGLQKVHDAGFLHRDIKPANVMLGEDYRPSLIDFGASRAAMADRTRTMTAIFTPGYAAPEQFTAAKQGPWTDIYGMAATLHYAIIGSAPPSAFDRLMEDTYKPLGEQKPPGFAPKLLVGIDGGLALHIEERPQTIAGWRAALGGGEPADGDATLVMPAPVAPGLGSTPTVHAAPPRHGHGQGHGQGHGRLIALAACMVVLVAAAGGYYLFAPTLEPIAPPVSTNQQQAAASAPKPEPPRPPPPAEAEEAGLKLTMAERQRIQVALTALGFDMRGSDGVFGPRSREMIAAWQKTQKHVPTGYLTASESRTLMREAEPKPPRVEQETEAAVPPGPTVAVAPPPVMTEPPPPVDLFFTGSLSGSATGGGPASLVPMEADLRLAGRQLSGRLVHPVCGAQPVALTVDGAGMVSGNLRLYEAGGCATTAASGSGRVAGSSLTLDLRSADASFRGTLSSRNERSPGRPVEPSGLRKEVP